MIQGHAFAPGRVVRSGVGMGLWGGRSPTPTSGWGGYPGGPVGRRVGVFCGVDGECSVVAWVVVDAGPGDPSSWSARYLLRERQ